MPRLIITDDATFDLQRCRDFLAAKAPQAAERAGVAIVDRLVQLTTTPQIGRPAPTKGLRELSIPFGDAGYVVLYRYDGDADAVFILAVRHAREAGYQ